MPLIITSNIRPVLTPLRDALGDVSDKKILTIVTAALVEDGYEEWLDHYQLDPLRELGFTLNICDLSTLESTKLHEKMAQTDYIFVSGGNTFWLLQQMQRCHFAQALDPFLKKGGTYIGSSAGGIICAPNIAYIAPMDEPNKAQLTNLDGLNHIDFYPIPHADTDEWGDVAHAIHHNTDNSRLVNENDMIILP